MEEIKYIHDIRNGDLVVTRDKRSFIKIDNYMVGADGWLKVLDYIVGNNSILDKDECESFDIIEIWASTKPINLLSFNLENRELVWKEQEQKYYIRHKWLDTYEFGFVYRDKENSCMGLYDLSCSDDYDNYQTRFTKKEIEEIKEKYNTTLEDFKIIPVKEI